MHIRSGRILVWLLACSVALNLGFLTAYLAYHPLFPEENGKPGNDLPPRHPDPDEWYRELDLTEAQKRERQASNERLFESIRDLHDDIRKEKKKLVDLLTATETDEAAVGEQLARISQLQANIQEKVVEHILEEKKRLPPDQRERFNRLIRDLLFYHHSSPPIPEK